MSDKRRLPDQGRITHPPLETFTGRAWGGDHGWVKTVELGLLTGCLDRFRRYRGEYVISHDMVLRLARVDARWAGADGTELYLSVRELARRAGCCERTAWHWRNLLVRSGLAVLRLRGRRLTFGERMSLHIGRGGPQLQRGLTNVYALTVPDAMVHLSWSNDLHTPRRVAALQGFRPDLPDHLDAPARAIRRAIQVARWLAGVPGFTSGASRAPTASLREGPTGPP